MGSWSSKLPAHESLRRAGLEVLLPSDEAYALRQESYFSKTASRLTPSCIVRPRSAAEVSSAVRVLVAGGHPFAIRSGGHAPMVGASNIDGGVTLDLGLLNWTKVVETGRGVQQVDGGDGGDGGSKKVEKKDEVKDADDPTPLVDIGPGARWADVYASLRPHGLAVAGGREGGVGVGGLVLGGGNTYFTAGRGFACDNVVAFEVVLAPDGRVVTADADGPHADLFWALRGGGNNFGVVTNFRMTTLRRGGDNGVWGGLTMMPWQVVPQAAEALTDFTSRIHEDVDSNLMCFFAYRPEIAQVAIIAVFAQVAGIEKAPAYEKWLSLPSIHSDCKMTSLADIVAGNTIPGGYSSIWFTATFKNDSRIVSRAASMHEELVNTLKTTIAPDGDFWALCLFQPLPKIFSEPHGPTPNALGLSRPGRAAEHDGLLLQTTVMVRTPEQEKLAYPQCKAFLDTLREFAASEVEGGGNLDWEYINYADASQNPLRSYGPDNVRRLKSVARKYDPQEIFQKLCRGGFKISEVEI